MAISARQGRVKNKKRKAKKNSLCSWRGTNNWIDCNTEKGLNIDIIGSNKVILTLPKVMNFSSAYEETSLHLLAIRKLAKRQGTSPNAYKLETVRFENLERISTSAALVLTAELSKWDDHIRRNLRPMTENWNEEIYHRLHDLGFFDLFRKKPGSQPPAKERTSKISLVKYIKGKCGDNAKAVELKNKIIEIVGEEITKWTFLYCGLSEAITNVSHHAYPPTKNYSESEKNWYLSASYNTETHELKVVFYDQGIGIPQSLPASKVWEKALEFLSRFAPIAGKKDEALLRAAVELDRTSTEQTDRGKGLQDLLEFIKQRKMGYLSILSMKGLYKFSIENNKTSIKTESFSNPIHGTLIIWKVTLTPQSIEGAS